MTIKVLWLSKGLKRGGAEVLLLEMASSPALHEFELHVASVLSSHMELAPELAQAGVEVHDLGGNATADPRWVVGLNRLLRRERFDIIHSHAPLPAAVARVLARARLNRPRTISTEHSSRSNYHPATRALNDATSRLDARRFAVSAESAESGWRWDKRSLEVVYHGRRLAPQAVDARLEVRTELGIPATSFVVMTVANMRSEKNLPMLIRAFAQVRGGPESRLVLVGDGEHREFVEAAITETGLGDSVLLTGSRSDVPRLLSAADVFALSSNFEGVPVAVMEALASDLPVVATEVGGLPEIVEHGVNGLLVPARNEAYLAGALGRLATDAPLRARMSAAATSSTQKFSIDLAAVRMAAAYREL